MQFLVTLIVIVIVSGIDPFMWIGPIIGAVASRKWWVPVALGFVNAVAVIILVNAMRSSTVGEGNMDANLRLGKLISGGVLGLIAFGIGSLIRNRKKTPTKPTS